MGMVREVIAGKEVSAIAVLGRLMTSYQPGGLSEKAAILSALDAPEEAAGLSQAVLGLRKWLRWHRRAGEIGVTRPDATIQVKGLGRLMKKVLKDNGDLAFRIQLAKSTLAIDTTPTEAAVMTYANHLLAEVEQVAHQDKKKGERFAPVLQDPKVKKIEGGKGAADGKGGGKERTLDGKGTSTCRYFISEFGCKKGKSCTFNHVLDDQRRCWNCGSTQHYAPKCDRPREGDRGQKGDGKGEGKQVRSVKKEENQSKPEDPAPRGEEGQNEVMKELLEEANKMLKSMTAPKVEERENKLQKLQRQLDDLRQLKVFRISRMEISETEGLLDSGATHSLRAKKKGEDVTKMKEIQVTLACGKKVPLKMTAGGTMIANDESTEPIIPMGKLVNYLGCSLGWTKKDGLVLQHPKKGAIGTVERGGCPHVPRHVALELIEELEGCVELVEINKQEVKIVQEKNDEEEAWLRGLVDTHPVLKSLPEKIRRELVRAPAQDLGRIPGVNKRMKKKWYRRGVTVHLYSGKDEGFTLRRAVREQGGEETLVLEVDVKNGDEWNMLEDDLYTQLLRLAMDDAVEGVVCGPNCRTRSVLRHFPIPGNPEAPRPVRHWGGGEWGSDHITPEEMRKVDEDDVLMWRAIMLAVVATHVRRAQRPGASDVRFLIEQPAPPEDYPEVVTWWKTEEWKELKKIYGWVEVWCRQGDLGGKAVKPTVVGGNLTMEFPIDRKWEKKKSHRGEEEVRNSKELERWAPGMMRQIAKDVVTQIQGSTPELRKLSWEEHIQMNHTPFRRDCRVCQETRQKQNPHRRVDHPLAGVLSLDTAGPYRDGQDLVMTSRYLMVGAFTWLVPKKTLEMREPEVEVPEEAPQVEEWRDHRVREERAEDERSPRVGPQEGEKGEDERSPREGPHRGEQEEEEMEIRTFRLACPVATKRVEETLRVAIEFVLRLKADGFHVCQIHTDQGHEYYGKFREWCDRRGILLTRTPGDDPQGNGRAEVAIQAITRQVRAALHQAKVGWEWWPMAARHVAETLRSHRTGKKVEFPPFMEEVTIRRRMWRRGVLMEPTTEKVKYICPAWDHHGHWVLKGDGTKVVTRNVIRRMKEPISEEVWIALEKEMLDALNDRRRMREKVSPVIRKIEKAEQEEEIAEELLKGEMISVMRLLEEEMAILITEDEEIAKRELKILAGLKKMVEVELEHEEILQTKIVSPYEVQGHWHEWEEASKDEIRSLLEEKEALRQISKEDLEELKRKAIEEGKRVFTRKPGPKGGKPKVRWVVCGNFETKRGEEDTFSSGADSTAMRMMIHMAAQNQGKGGVLDVKTAFLNADWKEGGDVVLVVRPPQIFMEFGVLQKESYYLPMKAVYGFRRSPKLWGDYRDSVLEKMEIKVQVEGQHEEEILVLHAMESEPNLWKIQLKNQDLRARPQVLGLVMTYVDDMFFVGEEVVVTQVMGEVRRLWKTSEPERVGGDPLRFLGVEVRTAKNKLTGGDDWIVSQMSYLEDLLAKEEVKERRIPISREQTADLLSPDGEFGVEDVRGAQKVVGELLWLLTRTRPDLMFVMSKLCSQVLRAPKKVQEVAQQVRGYLRMTKREGLKFEKQEAEEAMTMKVYTDASFAPDGAESHGCVIVKMGSSVISWKSGKQTLISLSTAEAELLEVVEGMALGESTAVLAEEISGELVRMAFTDSQSALAIMVNEGGSWRTRHLRMKAMYARQLVQKGVWVIQHLAGERMLADIGTKALASPRLQALKQEIGMVKLEEEKDEEAEEERKREGSRSSDLEVEQALRLLVLVAQVRMATAQPKEDGEDLRAFQWAVVVVIVFAVIGVINTVWWCIRYGTRCTTQPEEEPLLSEREEIRDQDGEREEEGLRRRVLSSQGSDIRRTQEEEQTRSGDVRMVSQEELIAEVRRAMRGEVVEPGGEPGTIREDIAGAVAVAEEVQHPADWDPETHGEIPCGKGEPPAAYFQRQRSKGKGPRPTWVVETGDGWRWQYYDPAKGAGERVGKGMPSSHGGGEPSSSKGGHGEGSERSSEAGQEAGSVSGKGSVTSISHRGASTVGGAGHGGDVGSFPVGTNERGPIYVTEYGEKYHVNVRCGVSVV